MLAACRVLRNCSRRTRTNSFVGESSLTPCRFQQSFPDNRSKLARSEFGSKSAAPPDRSTTPPPVNASKGISVGNQHRNGQVESIGAERQSASPDDLKPVADRQYQPTAVQADQFQPRNLGSQRPLTRLSRGGGAFGTEGEELRGDSGYKNVNDAEQNVQKPIDQGQCVINGGNEGYGYHNQLSSSTKDCQAHTSPQGGGSVSRGIDTLFEQLRNPSSTASRSKPPIRHSNQHPKPRGDERKGKKERGFHLAIRAASVEDIEQKLISTSTTSPNVKGVQFMLKELIEVRHIQPQARHYEALILSNCDARHGSASALFPIIAEMERENIAIGPSTLRAVLRALSVHPDARLLPCILKSVSSQWTSLTMADTTHIILCLSRLNQFELALPYLEQTIARSGPPNSHLESPIPQYLYTTILYRLASPSISDHTAALQLIYFLTDHNLPLSSVCVSYLLDTAAEALHLGLTLHLWRSHVDFNYIIPSTRLCQNALLTATRHGNAELATKAGQALEQKEDRNVVASGDGGGVDDDIGSGTLTLEELEMVKDAYIADTKARISVSTVTRLENRIRELKQRMGGKKNVK